MGQYGRPCAALRPASTVLCCVCVLRGERGPESSSQASPGAQQPPRGAAGGLLSALGGDLGGLTGLLGAAGEEAVVNSAMCELRGLHQSLPLCAVASYERLAADLVITRTSLCCAVLCCVVLCRACMCVCARVYVRICVRACVCACVRVCARVCVCACLSTCSVFPTSSAYVGISIRFMHRSRHGCLFLASTCDNHALGPLVTLLPCAASMHEPLMQVPGPLTYIVQGT